MKKKKIMYTPEQTNAIMQKFAKCESYEAQILAAQNLASSQLFSEFDHSHSAKEILAKVSSMSRPAIQPVLRYIKKPKPEPKPRKLEKFELIKIIEKILGYNMFNLGSWGFNHYTINRYVLADILKMLLHEKYLVLDNSAYAELGQLFAEYESDNIDISEFVNIVVS